MKLPRPLHTVTFDCWNTLLYERDEVASRAARAAEFRRLLREHGERRDDAVLDAAFAAGWRRHVDAWQRGDTSGAPEIVGWALAELELDDPALAERIVAVVQRVSLGQDVRALDGARATLERLRERGVRRALICDTGFTPGRVVRDLLDRHGLLAQLEVLAFSDEVGVPKPHPQMFRAALDGLAVETPGAVHVGDLLQTDVAGAREVGMASVRMRWPNDDARDLPEADAVADSHAHLLEILEIATP